MKIYASHDIDLLSLSQHIVLNDVESVNPQKPDAYQLAQAHSCPDSATYTRSYVIRSETARLLHQGQILLGQLALIRSVSPHVAQCNVIWGSISNCDALVLHVDKVQSVGPFIPVIPGISL